MANPFDVDAQPSGGNPFDVDAAALATAAPNPFDVDATAPARPRKKQPAVAMEGPPTLRTLSPKKGVNITELAPESHSVLRDLDDALHGLGVSGGIITSGKQHRAHKSHHTEGRAVDLVVPAGRMDEVAASLAKQGFRAQFERKGQVNPNGSVATGDHIHVTLLPRTQPRTIGELRAAEAAPAPAPKPKPQPVATAKVATTNPFDVETPKPTGRPKRMTLAQASAAAAGMPEFVDPGSAAAVLEPVKRGAATVGKEIGRGVNALTAGFNEMERRAQAARAAGQRKVIKSPLSGKVHGISPLADLFLNARFDVDPAFVQDYAAGARAAVSAFKKGEEVPATFPLTALFGSPEQAQQKLSPEAYGLAVAGSQLVPNLYDPNNILFPAAGALAERAAGALKGPALAAARKLSPGAVKAAEARAAGTQIIDNVIQPTQRHKMDLLGTVRQANADLKALRRQRIKSGLPDIPKGEHPIFDLAADYAAADTGRYPGRVTLSAADQQRLLVAAQAKGVPVALAQQTGQRLAANANDVLATMQHLGKNPLQGTTRQDWMREFFQKMPDGSLMGEEIAAQTRRALLIDEVGKFASKTPGPGLSKIPGEKWREYGKLAGLYVPSNVKAHLAQIVEASPKGNMWTRGVSRVKASYLYQPFTPTKNLIQNMGGVSMLAAKTGGTILDAMPHTGSSGREMWQFMTTGKLSKTLQEYSDIDPSILQQLQSVKVADGTAGRFIRVGDRTFHIPGVEATKAALLPTSTEHVFMKANSGVDVYGKLIGYKMLRARGFSPEAAVKAVNKHVISYGNLPPEVSGLLATMDRYGVWTFNNVPVQLALQTVDTARKAPHLLYRPGQYQQRMLKAFGVEKQYEKGVPQEKKSPFAVPNPLTGGRGFVDYSALSPLSQPYEMARALTEGVEAPPDPMDVLGGLVGRTVVSPVGTLLQNRGVIPEGAPWQDKALAMGKFASDTFNPLGRAGGQLAAATEGRSTARSPYAPPQTPGELIGGKFGVRKVDTGTKEQQRQAAQGAVQKRAAEAMPLWQKAAEEAARMDPAKNPYRGEARKYQGRQLAYEVQKVRKYIENLLIGNEPPSKEKFRRAALKMKALADRTQEPGATGQ